MSRLNRRSFLKSSMAAGMAAMTPFSQVRGANNDVRVAVVGFNSMGKSHINAYRKMPGVRIVALCDVDTRVLDWGKQDFAKRNEKVDTYVDYRKLLEDKHIDAVSIVTPNHWHSLMGIWACQAGKDATVEKPVSHNIFEGRQLAEASRKYNRMVQGDFDQRSKESMHEAIQWLQAGHLGKIRLARGRCYKHRPSLGKVNGPGPVPKTLDYNLWTGPAPLLPLQRKKLHYDWHWVWATGCGELGNNGPHQLDVCRWALGHDDLPARVFSIGGRFGYDDDGETANTQFIYYDYKPAPIIYEVRGLPPKTGESGKAMNLFEPITQNGVKLKSSYKGTGPNTGVIIECEHGYMDMGGPTAYDHKGNLIKQFTGENIGPQANFIKAVRSRKRSDLRNDILDGHLSTALSHMGNISHRIGKRTDQADILDAIKGNKDMVEVYHRFKTHLARNNVDLAKTPAILGPMLTMDSETERFTGDFSADANMLLTRNYRRPFVVPDKI
ncbi:MAG: Gfo/Idh/MocA family oxidoreductase [Phycisphaeraceae bacterium]|nr:Gfo/Idh/MocA family oxidoreductase [Phycisphaeraceae bacterium]